MRRLLPVVLLAAAALTAPAAASPAAGPLPTPGFASDNVEWLGNMPIHADTAGAHLLDGYLYVTSSSQLSIYDVRVPESPKLLSTVPSPQEPYAAEEDVDTNGEILLISSLGELRVYDVRDKAKPTQIGLLAGADEHTISCVLECTWAYGSAGMIIDLRDPTKPRRAGTWKGVEGRLGTPGTTHDVTEVAPGIVLTSTTNLTLLDLRADPAKPTVLAQATSKDKRFMHNNLWPREMEDRFLLVGGETLLTDCSDAKAGAFMTWDTTDWEKTGTFTMLDEYRPARSTVDQGDFPAQTFCSHWFTTRPGWEDGGQLAVGWYEHGTRFLEVDDDGQIEEIGFFSPAGTSSSAAYWASDDILYVLDYNRGFDVLRIHDEPVDRPIPPVPNGLLGVGLTPDQEPLTRRRFTPAMLVGDEWRC